MVLVGTIIMFIFFHRSPQSVAFITVNLVLVLVISVASVLPKIQERNPRSGLLQAAIVSLYSTYLVFSSNMR